MHSQKIATVFFLVTCLALPTAVWPAINNNCPAGTKRVIINFNRYPNGTLSKAGDMISTQWLSSRGGVRLTGFAISELGDDGYVFSFSDGEALRLLDSSNRTGGDYFLGTPNQGCAVCQQTEEDCPGVSTNDKEIAASTNCKRLRQVLIVDSGGESPKANPLGGTVAIRFHQPVPKMLSIGLLNVAKHEKGDEFNPTIYAFNSIPKSAIDEKIVAALGENTWKQVPLKKFDPFLISTMFVESFGPVAITHLKFCAAEPDDPLESICSDDPEIRGAALERIDAFENRELVARYNDFNRPRNEEYGDVAPMTWKLGDCCHIQGSKKLAIFPQIHVKACGASGESIGWPPNNQGIQDSESGLAFIPGLLRDDDGSPCQFEGPKYDNWDSGDRGSMCTGNPVDNLAAQLRHAVKQGACCAPS